MSSCLNSPPESVQSNSCNEDSNCATNSFLYDDKMQPERSYNFVDDALAEPMKNSQDLLYPGANGFHDEIEQVSKEQICDINDVHIEFVKTDYEHENEDSMEPILRNDFMLGEKTGFKFSQRMPKIEPIENSVPVMMALSDCNMNTTPKLAQPKLLAKRNQTLPKLQLKVKIMRPIESGNITNMDDKCPTKNNNLDVTTPQLYKDILDMERDFVDDKIDLISFIDSDNVSNVIFLKILFEL